MAMRLSAEGCTFFVPGALAQNTSTGFSEELAAAILLSTRLAVPRLNWVLKQIAHG
jgi:hypothetical protein